MNKLKKTHIQSILLPIALTLCSFSTHAVEITPLLGYRAGGEFIDEANSQKRTVDSSSTFGLILSYPDKSGTNYELYYSHQSSDLNSVSFASTTTTGNVNVPLTIDYLHIGGTTPISNSEKLETFVSGGLGFTYLSPDFEDLQSDLRASFSIGIGLKLPLSERIAFRIETRALATLYNNNSAIFCSGGCTLKVNGNFLLQTEVFAGIAVKF